MSQPLLVLHMRQFTCSTRGYHVSYTRGSEVLQGIGTGAGIGVGRVYDPITIT